MEKTDIKSINSEAAGRRIGLDGAFLCLILLLLATVGLRFIRFSDYFGGFEAPREARQLLAARNLAQGSPLEPTVDGSSRFLETGPLLAWLLYLFQGFAASPILLGRAITTTASLISTVLVFLIGRRLFSPVTGVLAAVFFSFAPVTAILAYTIEPTMVVVMLLLLAQWLCLRSWPDQQGEERPSRRAGGIAWGFAGIAALAAWLSAAGWLIAEMLRRKGIGLFRSRPMWSGLGWALAIGLPFYIYQFVTQPAQASAGLVPQLSLSNFLSALYWSECWWGFSPLFALLFLLGLIQGLRVGSAAVIMLLLQIFFLSLTGFQNPFLSLNIGLLTPYLSLLAAAALSTWSRRWLTLLVLLPAFLMGAMLSLLMLARLKLGHDELSQLQSFQQAMCTDCDFIFEDLVKKVNGSELEYYLGRDNLRIIGEIETDPHGKMKLKPNRNNVLLFLISEKTAATAEVTLKKTMYDPVFFGWRISARNPLLYRFKMISFQLEYIGPWNHFELRPVDQKAAFGIAYFAKDRDLYRRGAALEAVDRIPD